MEEMAPKLKVRQEKRRRESDMGKSKDVGNDFSCLSGSSSSELPKQMTRVVEWNEKGPRNGRAEARA